MISIVAYEDPPQGLTGYHVANAHSRFAGAWSNGSLHLWTYHGGQYKSHTVRCHNAAQRISLAHRWCQGYDV